MPEPGRRPLKPLPPELHGPVRDFTEQLRAVYRDRTELNQRGLAEALHLTKSPVSRYLNGQEVMPAETFAAFCAVAGLAPRERERLGRLRERAAEAAERARGDSERAGAVRTEPADAAAGPGAGAVPGHGRPRMPSLAARLRSPAGLGALAALAALCAGGFALTWTETSGGDAGPKADKPGPGPSCRTTRVYRVVRDGDILDGARHDIGDVRADDVFRLDTAPSGHPYRFRDYGHVAGSRTKGYVDQAKLKAIGSRCVEEHR